ncbi:Sec-independent protein translocase protein TatB, partial [Lysobacter sp. D1-1-M9]|uniref:Sec-independent protein translocase protein TatB n=2 Tax=Novilysobacter longmucuonensis TaxID=3098603 RepID=UPI0039830773
MFDIGFSELFLVALVALLVLGPERLPKAARFAGLWVRRARAQWYSVKSELEHELADEEFKRSLRQTHDDLREARDDLQRSGQDMQREFRSLDPDSAQPDRLQHESAPQHERPEPEPPAPERREPTDPAPDPQRRDPEPG